MKSTVAILTILLFLQLALTACTTKAPNSKTAIPADSVASQAAPQQTSAPTASLSITQQPQQTMSNSKAITKSEQKPTQTKSPFITKEPQQIINDGNTITKAEVEAFFNDDNEFATNMLQYPATDMNNLGDVMMMMLYPLGASSDNPISFVAFNEYTRKYLNRSYADSEFAKYATEELVAGTNVIMSKKVIYAMGFGSTDMLIEDIKITGNDSALLTCSRGLNRDEPDTMDEVCFNVQFGKATSELYIKNISKE